MKRHWETVKRVFLSKRGSELIEASLALPLLILMAASLIGAGAFACVSMHDRCLAQSELLGELDESRAVYRIIERNIETSSDITGAYRERLNRRYTVHARVIDEAAVIRAGKIAGAGAGGQENGDGDEEE